MDGKNSEDEANARWPRKWAIRSQASPGEEDSETAIEWGFALKVQSTPTRKRASKLLRGAYSLGLGGSAPQGKLSGQILRGGRYAGPAAAVIPAPIAYLNVVAVKKLVVEYPARTFASA